MGITEATLNMICLDDWLDKAGPGLFQSGSSDPSLPVVLIKLLLNMPPSDIAGEWQSFSLENTQLTADSSGYWPVSGPACCLVYLLSRQDSNTSNICTA